jgi:hypothetical protein
MNNYSTEWGTQQCCPDCGHKVPTANLAIHRARGCRQAVRGQNQRPFAAASLRTVSNLLDCSDDDDSPPPRVGRIPTVVVATVALPQSAASNLMTPISIPDSSCSSSDSKPAARQRRTITRGSSWDDGDVLQAGEFVDLASDSTSWDGGDIIASGSTSWDGGDINNSYYYSSYWKCTVCTLHNPHWRHQCEACHSANNNEPRPADPTRQEQLVVGTTTTGLRLGRSRDGGRVVAYCRTGAPRRHTKGGFVV